VIVYGVNVYMVRKWHEVIASSTWDPQHHNGVIEEPHPPYIMIYKFWSWMACIPAYVGALNAITAMELDFREGRFTI